MLSDKEVKVDEDSLSPENKACNFYIYFGSPPWKFKVTNLENKTKKEGCSAGKPDQYI